MGIFLLLMLLFPGVGGLSSVPRQFHVVQEEKNWTAAQQYCREEFTDLVTIDNMAEIDEIKRVMQDAGFGEGWLVWIGLRYGGSPKWQWSLADEGFYGENETEFRNWGTGEPSSNPGVDCVDVHRGGEWYGHRCTEQKVFICYNGPNASTHPYVLVEEWKNWTEAQRYCREKHTDLASVRNQEENDKIKDLINSFSWIGLFWFDGREWSDGSSSSFRHWVSGEPSYDSSSHGLCVDMWSTGLWSDHPCDYLRYFVCYESLPTVEVVSPQPPFYSGDNVTLSCDIPKYTGQHQYVWLKNSSPVPGKTNQAITITLPEDAGRYQCYRRRDGSSVAPYISTPVTIGYQDLPPAAVEVVSPQSPFYSGDVVTLSCDIPEYSDWHQYVWLKDSSPVPGKTNQTITITLPLEAGQYQCRGERGDRPETSAMSLPTAIAYHDLPDARVEVVSPQSLFYSGDNVTLKCNVTNYTDWHQYVWVYNGSKVISKTNQTITITLPLEAGQYQCSGERGDRPTTSSISSSVDITINALLPTVEVVSPQPPFYSGDVVTLSCDIPKYTGQHQYVWLKNSSPVPGKTNQTISITLPLEAGQYQCSGERGDRPETSSMSLPTVIAYHDLPDARVEVVSPQSLFYSGDNVTLKCNVTNYTDWHQYVWVYNGSKVISKTNQTITITLPLEAGQYQCSGERGDRPTTSSVSSSVNITINAPSVVILSPPPPFNSGDVVTLRCDIPESTSGQHVQYVWIKDSKLLPGETSKTITITNPGHYQCRKQGDYISRPLEITFTPRLSQVVRVKMQLPPGVDVEDEKVQNAFLQQIGDKLKANGLAADAKLSWKKQPDGKVLHKEKNGKKKKRDEL